jgi:hypothetical protein
MPHPCAQALEPLPFGTEPLLRSGAQAVAYHIPVSPLGDGQNLKTTIALPRGSAWTSGLHFHATHVEYLLLRSGSIFVELENQIKVFSALSGGEFPVTAGQSVQQGLIIQVPRYARHNWGRAEHYTDSGEKHVLNGYDKMPEDWRDEVIVEEWTESSDLGKPLFFWNLNRDITTPSDSVLPLRQSLARSLLGDGWIPFQLFVIFYELDNWPVFFSLTNRLEPYLGNLLGRWLEKKSEHMMTFAVLFTAKVMAWILRVTAVTRERTPPDLWEAYKRGGIKGPRNQSGR